MTIIVWSLSADCRFTEKFVNNKLKVFINLCSILGGFSYRHSEIEEFVGQVYRKDLIHLSDIIITDVKNWVERSMVWLVA